jgi:hypothetical protein
MSAEQPGLRFVVLFGVLSLFADFAYEGARSILGPFLATLGASGFVVGSVAGLGELLGYVVRLASGRFADFSRRYWPITLAGYFVQLPAVPALALATNWPVAAGLIVAERAGKGTRNPPRDVMLAAAGEHLGQGWAFGVYEALDQAGALIGPLVIAGVLAATANGYHIAFAVLVLPVAVTLAILLRLRLQYPDAGAMAPRAEAADAFHYPAAFWWYAAGAAAVAFGFADYPLISYHFAKASTVSGPWVPIFYALAMGAGGLGSLAFGKVFDRFGLVILAPVTAAVAVYAPLVFFGGFDAALVGAVLWGVGLGAHESLMSAALATMIPAEHRGSAYGLFTALFGTAWFIGSAAEGALYDVSITGLVALSMVAQFAGIFPILRAYSLAAKSAPLG